MLDEGAKSDHGAAWTRVFTASGCACVRTVLRRVRACRGARANKGSKYYSKEVALDTAVRPTSDALLPSNQLMLKIFRKSS